MITISVTEARACLPELVQRACDGEQIVLTRRGRPVARLGPVDGSVETHDRVEARRLLWFKRGKITQLGREGPLVGSRWRPGRHGGGLSAQVLRDRR